MASKILKIETDPATLIALTDRWDGENPPFEAVLASAEFIVSSELHGRHEAHDVRMAVMYRTGIANGGYRRWLMGQRPDRRTQELAVAAVHGLLKEIDYAPR